jgi:hypothetical protein
LKSVNQAGNASCIVGMCTVRGHCCSKCVQEVWKLVHQSKLQTQTTCKTHNWKRMASSLPARRQNRRGKMLILCTF